VRQRDPAGYDGLPVRLPLVSIPPLDDLLGGPRPWVSALPLDQHPGERLDRPVLLLGLCPCRSTLEERGVVQVQKRDTNDERSEEHPTAPGGVGTPHTPRPNTRPTTKAATLKDGFGSMRRNRGTVAAHGERRAYRANRRSGCLRTNRMIDRQCQSVRRVQKVRSVSASQRWRTTASGTYQRSQPACAAR
jgi:hypothetical protein